MPDDAPARGRRLDFVAIGRAAVDLYGEQIGGRLEDMASFAKYVGGCPANISIGAARLGLKPAMITRVGDEHMGRFVRETLAAEGVDVSGVRTDPERLTGLVVLGIRDRETFPLIFFRENCADMALAPGDIDAALIENANAVVVTGTHFSRPNVDAACRLAIEHARRAGAKVVLDIDYRPVLWGLTGKGLGEQRYVASANVSAHLQSIVPLCDLIVGTEEELHIAGGTTDTLAAARRVRALSAATIVVKLGARGCVAFPGAIPARIEDGILGPGFPVEVFNVLGAGDGFMAGLLRGWLRGEGWERAMTFANACGALVVSRHGCAPAMPTWPELQDFLTRADRVTRLHDDARVARLHRVTTRRGAWPEVMALAFDHRRQFEDLADAAGTPRARIPAFKRLIADALDEVGTGLTGVGAIIDDAYGRDALYAATGGGLWLARPVELPGSRPLEFAPEPDPALLLRGWPLAHVAKCLVSYSPHDDPPLRAAQEAQLLRLWRACLATGHEVLLEVVPPDRSAQQVDVVAGAMERFYALGIVPDWWKLPPFTEPAHWRRLGDIVRRHDPHCRGILVLGLQAPESELDRAFKAAAAEESVRGFAVGRSIFWPAAELWFAGQATDAQARSDIAAAYRRVVGLWRDRTR